MSSTPSSASSRQLGEAARRGARALQLVDRPVVGRDHRDDLLGEHVERVARVRASPRSRPSRMRSATDRALEQVAAVLREDRCRGWARRRWWPARPIALQPARRPTPAPRSGSPDRPRPCRCRARGELVATTACQPPGLAARPRSARALLAAHRAVMGARHALAGEPRCSRLQQALGEPAGVGEDDRAAVGADQRQRRVPRRAARSTPRAAAPAALPLGIRRVARESPVRSSTGTSTRSLERLRPRARRRRYDRLGAAEELGARRRSGAPSPTSPMRCAGCGSNWSSRSRLSAR